MNLRLKKIHFIILLLIPILSYGVSGVFEPLKSNYTSDATINENFILQSSDASPANFVGFMFKDSNTLNVAPDATVMINLQSNGNYTGYSGVIFRGQNGNTYTINGGSIVFNVEKVGGSLEGLIMTQARNYGKNANFDINANFSLTASADVYIQRGVFTSNGPNGGYFKFTKNVFIDVSQMQPSKGWGGARNGKGYRMIFSLEGSGNVYVNYNEATGQTLDRNNIIQLKGDLSAESTSKGNININLDNPQSFFQGRISVSPGSASNIELYLNHGGKWILNANSQITTLNTNNESYVVDDLYKNLDKLAVVDFTRIADDGLSYRLTSNDIYKPRSLKVKTINGQNGVFRLMADMPSGQIDTIQAQSVNGQEFIQVYQNPDKIFLDSGGKKMVVASVTTPSAATDFKGIPTIIGLYDYLPIINRVDGASGSEWILSSIERNPNQTAKSLLNVLSLPYQIFRLESDSLYVRFDEMVYPPTINGLWAKVQGGGIYLKQPYGDKTTQSLFYNFNGGYDYGVSSGDDRYFFGGGISYTHLNAADAGYQGRAQAFGFGGYAGYVKDEGWVVDGGIRYIFAPLHSEFYQSSEPLDFKTHIFLMGARVGYRFYPFFSYRAKKTQRCVQGVFCRNTITQAKVRDPKAYLEPYVSLNPGVVLGEESSFIDELSRSTIHSKLDPTFAMIGKIGLMGVKRYDYAYGGLSLKALMEYSMDLNLGGKVTLVDNMQIPLYNDPKHIDNRLGISIGLDLFTFNDSLKFTSDFKTEFFGRLNTYWLLSASLRYKFGQRPQPPNGASTINYRPQPPKSSAKKKYFKPYQTPKSKDTFYEKNHFKTLKNSNPNKQQANKPTIKPTQHGKVRAIQRPQPTLKTVPSWGSQRPTKK